MSVVQLVAPGAGGLAPDRDSLARKLELLAQDIRAGRWDVATAIVIRKASDGCIGWHCYGQPVMQTEAIGMLEWAKIMLYQDAGE